MKTIQLSLNEDKYNLFKSGKKCKDIRRKTPKTSSIKIGDSIMYFNNTTHDIFETSVSDVKFSKDEVIITINNIYDHNKNIGNDIESLLNEGQDPYFYLHAQFSKGTPRG